MNPMEPKFQSSFIPKTPITSSSGISGGKATRISLSDNEGKGPYSTIATAIFTISIILVLGLFGYKFYLNYRIGVLGIELEGARATLDLDTITELLRLNDRLKITQNLISNHKVLTPLFSFLEESTQGAIRFNNISYTTTDKGIELTLRGQAQGYSVLAAQAEIWQDSGNFRDQQFSNLTLDDRGQVIFSFSAIVDPRLVSYTQFIESIEIPSPEQSPIENTTTTTATSSPATN